MEAVRQQVVGQPKAISHRQTLKKRHQLPFSPVLPLQVVQLLKGHSRILKKPSRSVTLLPQLVVVGELVQPVEALSPAGT